MKHIIVYCILIINSIIAFSQSSIRSMNNTTALAENNQWNLDEYVWSHAPLRPGKVNKQLLDFEAIDNWVSLPSLDDVSISRNGEYFAYGIQNNLRRRLDTLVVQSTSDYWRVAITGASPGFFSADSRQYIFQDKNGLCFLRTGSGQRSC